MDYSYQVKRWNKGNRTPEPTEVSGEITGPDALGMATRLAEQWASDQASRAVTLLCADCQGVNAGVYFLHRVIKAS